VVPLREVTLAAEVAGRVRHKAPACNEGQFVKAGTLLFEIDPRDYELDVERLERELKQSGLAIEEIDAELAQNAEAVELARRQVELAKRESKRLEGLKAGKIVTESEHDRAMREELTAANVVTTLEGQKRVLAKRRIRLEEAESLASTLLAKANLDLGRTRIVAPAEQQLARAGLDITGPLPADTLFLRASMGGFDGVVALYHDQGHIPIKLLGMHRAVNITLGLPLVRTSW
jgi:multidrug resistance efflux pump